MSIADDDVGRDLGHLLVLANIFPRDDGAGARTGGDVKILWGRGWIPGVQTLRGKIGLRHMGGHG